MVLNKKKEMEGENSGKEKKYSFVCYSIFSM